MSGGAGKGNRTPVINIVEKSDTSILSKKPPNNARPAEEAEKREVAKGKRSWLSHLPDTVPGKGVDVNQTHT